MGVAIVDGLVVPLIGGAECQSLLARSYLIGRLELSHDVRKHRVQVIIAVGWVVVEGHEMFYICQSCELEGVPDAAMSESDPGLVFLFGILCVMDQQVGAFCQPVARNPCFIVWERTPAQRRLVVWQVGHRRVSVLDPVSNGRVRMNDQLGCDGKFPDLDRMRRQLMEAERGSQLVHAYREQRGGKILLQAGAQRERRAGGSPEMDLHPRPPQRRKKREPLDVIHMQMGQQDVDLAQVCRKSLTQIPQPRPCIENEQIALAALH